MFKIWNIETAKFAGQGQPMRKRLAQKRADMLEVLTGDAHLVVPA